MIVHGFFQCTGLASKLYIIYYRIVYFADERKFVTVAKQSERRKVRQESQNQL